MHEMTTLLDRRAPTPVGTGAAAKHEPCVALSPDE